MILTANILRLLKSFVFKLFLQTNDNSIFSYSIIWCNITNYHFDAGPSIKFTNNFFVSVKMHSEEALSQQTADKFMLVVGLVRHITSYSFLPIRLPSKWRQKLFSFHNRCFIFSALIFPLSSTLLHIAGCDGVGKSAPPSAKLWQTLEAYLVDEVNFETRPYANLALRYFRFEVWSSGVYSELELSLYSAADSLENVSGLSVVLHEPYVISAFILRLFNRWIVDFVASFVVVYPIKPCDSIGFL